MSGEHSLHGPAPRGRRTSRRALGHALGLGQGKVEQIPLHARTHARTHHPLSPRLHLITPDAPLITHSPNTHRPPTQPSSPAVRLSFASCLE